MADAPHLLAEKDGHVLTITLNRPTSRNALSPEMLARLNDAWDQLDGDDDLRVAILTGADGQFCAGADLKAMGGGFGADEWTARFQEDPDLHWKALLRHRRITKPLVAAVEGYCLAGGTEILQATDIRVAGESARFGLTEPRWGLFPIGGSTVRLRRQIPYTRAAEILLTARQVPAPEALEIGLVGRIVPDGEALATARELADRVAANGPVAIQAILRALRETEGLRETEALARELEIGQPVFASEDAQEGPRAFAEKRPPVFKGR